MGHHDHGMLVANIAEQYGLDEALVGALVAYGEAHRGGAGDAVRTPG